MQKLNAESPFLQTSLNKVKKEDVLGTFEIRRMTVRNEKGTEVNFITKNYRNSDIIIFEQHFLNGIENPGNRSGIVNLTARSGDTWSYEFLWLSKSV